MIASLLTGLSEFYGLATLYQLANSKEASLSRKITLSDSGAIGDWIYDRKGGKIIRKIDPLTGCMAGAWNGGDGDEGAELTFRLGASARMATNFVVISLGAIVFEKLRRQGAIPELLKVLIEVCKPSWGFVTSHELMRALSTPPKDVDVGFVTYVSGMREFDGHRELIDVEKFYDGQLITIGEASTSADARTVELAKLIRSKVN